MNISGRNPADITTSLGSERPSSDLYLPLDGLLYHSESHTGSIEEASRPPTRFVSLDALLRKKHLSLPPRRKFLLAAAISTGIVQLGTTPWCQKFSSQSVGFPEVFPTNEYRLGRVGGPFEFGIDLTRLHITTDLRTAIERSVEYSTIPMSTIFALGVVLTELALLKNLDALVEASERSESGGDQLVARQLCAQRVSKTVANAMGKRYGDAVDWCLTFGLKEHRADLHDKEICAEMHRCIVEPLLEMSG